MLDTLSYEDSFFKFVFPFDSSLVNLLRYDEFLFLTFSG